MVSNHYVLSRKVQRAFDRSSISSRALHQLLVDVLTNLSSLTLILSTVVAFRMDSSLSVMIYSDAAWSGLLLTVIAIRGTK
jgi:spore maturation protein SpmA